MGVELLLEPEEISADDLVTIFRAFCESYGIKPTKRDERFLRTQGIGALRTERRLDYRISIGGHFFVEDRVDYTFVWDNLQLNESERKTKDKKFQEAVKRHYLSQRKSYVVLQQS